jgi:hypothetical protein
LKASMPGCGVRGWLRSFICCVFLIRETAAVLFVGQEIGRESKPTPRQHRHQPLAAQGTDEARERQRRETAEGGTTRRSAAGR